MKEIEVHLVSARLLFQNFHPKSRKTAASLLKIPSSLIINYEVSVLLVKSLFSLPYDNITLLESDRETYDIQVSELIS